MPRLLARLPGFVAKAPQAPTPSKPRGPERRRHGRLRTDGTGDMGTPLGPVMDLSRSGMRVRVKGWPPLAVGDKCALEVRFAETSAVFPVEVMRIIPAGKGEHDLGLSFRTLDAQQSRALNALARTVMSTADLTHSG